MMVKYSILIPSRNGAKYLPFAVKSALSQDFKDCEVIASVNHSSDDSLERLKEFQDPRLRVTIPPTPLSMPAHFEWLLTQAKGEWITIIGDDDALMPYFFEELEKILCRWPDVKAISSRRAYYYWNPAPGKQVVDYESFPHERTMGGAKSLFLALLGLSSHVDMPQLYTNGVMHSSLIHEIKARSHARFYHEMNPDVYSGVAIAASLKKFLRTERPLFWVGTSSKSVGLSITMSEQGSGSQEMKARAAEFEEMSKKDDFGIAHQIELSLWRKGISTAYVLSALRKLPFKVGIFERKWAEYFVMASILTQSKTNGGDELKACLQRHCEKMGLSSTLVSFCAFITKSLKRYVKLKKSLVKRVKKRPAKLQFFSKDGEAFANIELATQAILRLRQGGQT